MDKIEAEKIVTETYRMIFGRDPDPCGLTNYTNMLLVGASQDRLIQILKESDEYQAKKKSKSRGVFDTIPEAIPAPVPLPAPDTDIKFIDTATNAYRTVLGREPDIGGLQNYVKQMKMGLTEENLITSLKESDEFRMKNIKIELTLPGGGTESRSNIAYCMMGTDRLHEIKDYIPGVLPYVDSFIFIDGGSSDGTVDYLRSLKSDKVEVYAHLWNDQFSGQRNNYVRKLRDRNFEGFMLVSDSDEHFPEDTLKSLKAITAQAEQMGISNIMFNSVDIILDDNDRNQEMSRHVSSYWKSLMFKFNPGLHYEGEPHETVMGVSGQGFKTGLKYEHARSRRKIVERATENWWISNSNRYSEKWVEFRWYCTKNGIDKFKDYFARFKEGSLPAEIENWIYDHREDNMNEGDSEVREMAQLYFEMLHPEKRKG